MKKLQYVSPACEVINVNVKSQFLQFSATGNGTSIGQKPIEGDGSDFDVKGEGGFWDEW